MMLQNFGIFLLLLHLDWTASLEVLNQWNLLDFTFPYDPAFVQAFRPENTVFTGLEITPDRIFLAMPRLRAGIPATLATIPRHLAPGTSPPLRPYPDWSFHTVSVGDPANCTGLTSVYRIRKDSCNRLWVLDSGIMTSLDDFQRICPPKILVFDLRTDRIVRTIFLPRRALRPSSLLANLVIDESIQGGCDSSFVYIADTVGPGIVVYDGRRDVAWRILHPSMYPDPDFSDYTIGGERFTLMDGVVGLGHSPRLATLFYQPLATDRIFSISTAVITRGPPREGDVLPVMLAGRKSSQGLGLGLDQRDDSLIFGPLTETSVASWNPTTGVQKLLAYDPDRLQFPTEIRWNDEDGSVWLLTTRFQKYFLRTVRPQEINLRIIRIPARAQVDAVLPSNELYYKK